MIEKEVRLERRLGFALSNLHQILNRIVCLPHMDREPFCLGSRDSSRIVDELETLVPDLEELYDQYEEVRSLVDAIFFHCAARFRDHFMVRREYQPDQVARAITLLKDVLVEVKAAPKYGSGDSLCVHNYYVVRFKSRIEQSIARLGDLYRGNEDFRAIMNEIWSYFPSSDRYIFMLGYKIEPTKRRPVEEKPEPEVDPETNILRLTRLLDLVRTLTPRLVGWHRKVGEEKAVRILGDLYEISGGPGASNLERLYKSDPRIRELIERIYSYLPIERYEFMEAEDSIAELVLDEDRRFLELPADSLPRPEKPGEDVDTEELWKYCFALDKILLFDGTLRAGEVNALVNERIEAGIRYNEQRLNELDEGEPRNITEERLNRLRSFRGRPRDYCLDEMENTWHHNERWRWIAECCFNEYGVN